ncbi:MAG: hypothetical protein HY819_21980 [Acidobacteria bacterium]|nr:hypothetical protein [Acidobacteriota bacterium]
MSINNKRWLGIFLLLQLLMIVSCSQKTNYQINAYLFEHNVIKFTDAIYVTYCCNLGQPVIISSKQIKDTELDYLGINTAGVNKVDVVSENDFIKIKQAILTKFNSGYTFPESKGVLIAPVSLYITRDNENKFDWWSSHPNDFKPILSTIKEISIDKYPKLNHKMLLIEASLNSK